MGSSPVWRTCRGPVLGCLWALVRACVGFAVLAFEERGLWSCERACNYNFKKGVALLRYVCAHLILLRPSTDAISPTRSPNPMVSSLTLTLMTPPRMVAPHTTSSTSE